MPLADLARAQTLAEAEAAAGPAVPPRRVEAPG
jgi:hypothetical protein